MREEGEHEGRHSERTEATEEFRRRVDEKMQEKRGGEMVQGTERKPDAGHSYIRLRAVERTSPRF